MEFPNHAIEFQVLRHKFVSERRRVVQRISAPIPYRCGAKTQNFGKKGLYSNTCPSQPVSNNDAASGAILQNIMGR
jgi:hypothetical protein